ncbi:MAG: hypothetical protein GQ582_03430 [Methyloprofundus sp.]|nr:hypothetical protein [Methyloprofundus sp.]
MGTSITVLAGNTSAFVVAVGGPQVAISLGVVAIAGIVKTVYSNRDHAHSKLRPFVWTLIDDDEPELNIWGNKEHLQDAANAAVYLMKHAGSQYEQMGHKLSQAHQKFNVFWEGHQRLLAPLTNEINGEWQVIAMMIAWDESNGSNESLNKEMVKLSENLKQIKDDADKKWKVASQQGGEVFEFMRRLIHVGNYLQCAGIIQEATFASLGATSSVQTNSNPNRNPLAHWSGAQGYRKPLQEISDVLEEADINYKVFNNVFRQVATKFKVAH